MTTSAACSVVIVNYNTGPLLTTCIETVFDAAGTATVDVVIVDNASHDGSTQAAHDAFPGVQVIENPDNRGFARAANQGIEATTAPWVFVLNPDAEVRSGSFSELIAFAEEDPKAAVVGVLTTEPNGEIYPSARAIPRLSDAVGHALVAPFKEDNRFTRRYTMADWDRRSAREVDWVSGSCMLLRRAALEQLGSFDPGYFIYVEDVDLCTRFRRAGWKVWFTPVMTVMHERGVSSAGSRRLVYEHSRSVERYVRTWVLTGWKRIFLPVAKAVLYTRAAVVARKATAP